MRTGGQLKLPSALRGVRAQRSERHDGTTVSASTALVSTKRGFLHFWCMCRHCLLARSTCVDGATYRLTVYFHRLGGNRNTFLFCSFLASSRVERDTGRLQKNFWWVRQKEKRPRCRFFVFKIQKF